MVFTHHTADHWTTSSCIFSLVLRLLFISINDSHGSELITSCNCCLILSSCGRMVEQSEGGKGVSRIIHPSMLTDPFVGEVELLAHSTWTVTSR